MSTFILEVGTDSPSARSLVLQRPKFKVSWRCLESFDILLSAPLTRQQFQDESQKLYCVLASHLHGNAVLDDLKWPKWVFEMQHCHHVNQQAGVFNKNTFACAFHCHSNCCCVCAAEAIQLSQSPSEKCVSAAQSLKYKRQKMNPPRHQRRVIKRCLLFAYSGLWRNIK